MKSKIFRLLLITALFASCSNQNKENKATNIVKQKNKDFYDLEWGMGKAEVKSILGKETKTFDGDLYYDNREVSELKCTVYCAFLHDSLVRGYFSFYNPSSTNPQKYIIEFDRLKSLLIEKYNKPILDTVICSNLSFLGDKPDWGTALFLGTLELNTKWDTPRSTIYLKVSNPSSDHITFGLLYHDRTKLKMFLDEIKSTQKQGL
jgi:hypothetical protein